MRALASRSLLVLALATAMLSLPPAACAGEPSEPNEYPSWEERVLHASINRARADPAAALAPCARDGSCPDARCYEPREPLAWSPALARAARFHSDEMLRQRFFAHDSVCTLVDDLAERWPDRCDGSASCACVGGRRRCSSICTSPRQRAALFGARYTGEIVSTASDPLRAFDGWLHERTNRAACAFSHQNGHRWLILGSSGAMGAGVVEDSTVELGEGSPPGKIPSGAHYPRQASSVEVWVSWYDEHPPREARVNVDGRCTPLRRQRGSSTNGAWSAVIRDVGSGCHRYAFELRDAAGEWFRHPSEGSFGIGPPDRCPDWSSARPATCERRIER